MDSKLNHALKKLPEGTVATQAWLEKLGVYRQLTRRYVSSGWLERFGHGAFKRAGDSVDWLGAVHALHEQLGLDVHVAGETALLLKGFGHFIPLGGGHVVHLFGDKRARLPTWFTRHSWPVKIDYRSPRLFDGLDDVGFGEVERGRFLVRIAAPERAILEVIYLASTNDALEHAHQLMNGLSTLRPDLVQRLLKGCRSIRVKRYFLWSAETAGHAWFQKLRADRVDLGEGKRQLFKNGAYNSTYQITVPPQMEKLPRV
ncbi:MAG: type IV toxin-antitoxin system AbiEi family antitoxin domain-containing protein [bacterium]